MIPTVSETESTSSFTDTTVTTKPTKGRKIVDIAEVSLQTNIHSSSWSTSLSPPRDKGRPHAFPTTCALLPCCASSAAMLCQLGLWDYRSPLPIIFVALFFLDGGFHIVRSQLQVFDILTPWLASIRSICIIHLVILYAIQTELQYINLILNDHVMIICLKPL